MCIIFCLLVSIQLNFCLLTGYHHYGLGCFIPIQLLRNYGCTNDIRFCLMNSSIESSCSGSGHTWTEAVVSRDRGVEGSHQPCSHCSNQWFPMNQGDVGPRRVKREGKGKRSWAVDILHLHVDYKELQPKRNSDAKSNTADKSGLRVKKNPIVQSSRNHKKLPKNSEIM